MTQTGTLFIVSGTSGAGKNTVIRAALERLDRAVLATTATTRPPRPGEVDGKDYYFLSADDFRCKIDDGAFVEWAEVHGHYYGTLRAPLEAHLAAGNDVFLQIDVQGMRGVREAGLNPVTIFLMAPSLDEIARRLRARGTDSEATIALRLQNAQAELAARPEYDYVIVNDTVENATARLVAIVEDHRTRRTTNATTE